VLGLGPVVPGAPFVRTFSATGASVYLKLALPLGADGVGTFELDIAPQE